MLVYIKTKEEQEGFKIAGKLASKVMASILEQVKPGVTTQFLNEFAIDQCKKLNAKPTFLGYEGFPAAICASPNKVLVHGIPDTNPLNNKDILSIDVGVELNGFIGDTAETVMVGGDSSSNKLISECRFALRSAIAQIKDGSKLSDIGRVITKIAKDSGFRLPEMYGGHGIDRNRLHADPFVANSPEGYEDITLRKGMVIAIEPMFIDGDPGTYVLADKWTVMTKGLAAHCEHTVLIEKDSTYILTDR